MTDLKLDPVTLEVVRSALPAIANEMAVDLTRTSYNMMIYEVRDFCTSLVAVDGALISQNVGGVSHFVADLGAVIVDGVKQHGIKGFAPGDVIITNHQAVAGQHLNNIVIYMPYFFEGELMMFSMVRAHWIDVGGMSTGFSTAGALDPWMEGLQIDQLKIYEAGKPDEKMLKMIRDNIRFPDSSMGDLRSQIAACKLALRRLDELYQKFGRETISAVIAQIFRETEIKCRKIVSTFPDGVYEAESFIDSDGANKAEPLRIHARVTVAQGHMTIDLSGCVGQRRAAVNSRTLAGARVAYKCLTAPNEPVNEGSFAALDVIIPEGNIMMAKFPAPMAGWSTILPTVTDVIIAALAPAAKELVPAAHSGILGGSVVFYGMEPGGKRFLLQSIEGGGWGGRPTEDGENASVSICQGDVRNGTIETLELKNPVVVLSRALRPDSGGPGKFRGGLAIEIHVETLAEGRWNLHKPKRTKYPPWGLWEGKEGRVGDMRLRRPGENNFKSMDESRYLIPPGSEVSSSTNGGGGWGNPLEREPERVQADVRDGYVSFEKAREDYGVVLDPLDLTIDPDATAKLRAAMALPGAAE